MVIDASFVKRHIKPKADSTLLNMKKTDLIEYIRTLEHNYNVAVSFNEQQAINIEAMIKNGVTVKQWIPVSDMLPEPEQEVFVCVRSKISNYSYVCCAMYVPENWYRQSSDFCWDFECCDDYDEEKDDFIVKQGWYESIHNWDDYSVVGIEDIVTHWMMLPDLPQKEDNNGC